MDFVLNSCFCGTFTLKTGSFWCALTIMGCSIAALVYSQHSEFNYFVNPVEEIFTAALLNETPVYRNLQIFAAICLIIVICASICALHAVFKGQRDYLVPALIVYPCAFIVMLFFTYKVLTMKTYIRSFDNKGLIWVTRVDYRILCGCIVAEVMLAYSWLVIYSYYKRFF